MKHLRLDKEISLGELLRFRWWIALSATICFRLIELYARLVKLSFVNQSYLGTILACGVFLPCIIVFLHNTLDHAARQGIDAAIKHERQQIARELHDSLGQNLNYLHIKLEYLAMQERLDPALAQELKRMQIVADEACKQVRSSLIQLNEPDLLDLDTALLEQATLVSQRAGFAVDFATEGQATQLLLNTYLTIIYIFREALINIEKHAHAHQIQFRAIWTSDSLKLCLADDGCGFAPEARLANSHFGIKTM